MSRPVVTRTASGLWSRNQREAARVVDRSKSRLKGQATVGSPAEEARLSNSAPLRPATVISHPRAASAPPTCTIQCSPPPQKVRESQNSRRAIGFLRFRNVGDELQIVEPAVETIVGDQLVMRSTFDDSPLVDDDDQVGAAHGRETVGND